MDREEKSRARMYHLACHLDDGLRLKSNKSGGASIARSDCGGGPAFFGIRRDSMLLFARPGSEARGQFMRLADLKQQESEKRATPAKDANKISSAAAKKHDDEPCKNKAVKSHEDETPLFARPASDDRSVQIKSSRPTTETSGFEWFPRMDITETENEHIVTVELPGVNAEGIRVEIDHGRLVVTGFRSREWWSNSPINAQDGNHGCRVYHRRDISYGPYRSVWNVPKNANLNGANAEFIDGFLRVIIPKSQA